MKKTYTEIAEGTESTESSELAIVADFEGDVDDGFEVDGGAGFGGGAEFPLAEGGFGVGVELRVEAADDLNVADGTVGANDGVEDDLALNILFD
jgi:hypothetical protein